MKRSYYFAYGSNLLKKRLIDRIGHFHHGSIAILNGYKFIYNQKGVDGTAKANIIEDSNSQVLGVCYEIDEEGLHLLHHRYEIGYDRTLVNISLIDSDQTIKAQTFTSQLTTSQPVCENYRQIIIQGAKQWGINNDYINRYFKQN